MMDGPLLPPGIEYDLRFTWWSYRDPNNVVQGPFGYEVLKLWAKSTARDKSGKLSYQMPRDLRVWRVDRTEAEYVELACLFGLTYDEPDIDCVPTMHETRAAVAIEQRPMAPPVPPPHLTMPAPPPQSLPLIAHHAPAAPPPHGGGFETFTSVARPLFVGAVPPPSTSVAAPVAAPTAPTTVVTGAVLDPRIAAAPTPLAFGETSVHSEGPRDMDAQLEAMARRDMPLEAMAISTMTHFSATTTVAPPPGEAPSVSTAAAAAAAAVEPAPAAPDADSVDDAYFFQQVERYAAPPLLNFMQQKQITKEQYKACMKVVVNHMLYKKTEHQIVNSKSRIDSFLGPRKDKIAQHAHDQAQFLIDKGP